MERLLFSDTPMDARRCAIARAVAKNVSTIANETAADWYVLTAAIKTGEKHPLYYENMDELATRLFTELLTGFQMISDQKVALPLGTSLEKAKAKKAEGWRSERPVRNIQKNAEALFEMSKMFMAFLPEKDRDELVTQFGVYLKAANALPKPLTKAIKNEEQRKILTAFRKTNSATRNMLVEKCTKHLGLIVGFNSLDGD